MLAVCDYATCKDEATLIVNRFGFYRRPMCVKHGLIILNSDAKEGVTSELLPLDNPQTGAQTNGRKITTQSETQKL